MNPQELRSLLTELVQAITQVMESGEELSDEFQGQIAQTLANLVKRIDGGEAQEPPGDIGNITPPLEPGPYPSSNVNSFKYDPRNGRLFVKFHGAKSADTGPVYKYEGVPKNIYDVFSQGRVGPKTSGENQYHRWIKGVTPSLGASLNALIKNGGYSYARMS